MLSLPETLLLFALDDDRGNVHASAFLGLEEALYASVLAELMLRGMIRVRARDGAVKLEKSVPDTDSVLLLLAMQALQKGKVSNVDDALDALATHLRKIRSRVTGALAAKGILNAREIDRKVLEDAVVHPTEDTGPEAEMRRHLRNGINQGAGMSRRIGMLVGLSHLLDLWRTLLPDELYAEARAMGAWVLERDAICRATRVAVMKAQGTWEG